VEDLRNVSRHPKYKTDLCRTYHSVGFCPYGPRCHFVHAMDEVRNTPAQSPTSRRGMSEAQARITGDSMPDRRREDTAAIRVSNLSENVQEADLQELFKPFGNIARIFLAKDKVTGQCKGFAFVNYYRKEDAAKAIATLNGYGYDYLILSVEWAKPALDR